MDADPGWWAAHEDASDEALRDPERIACDPTMAMVITTADTLAASARLWARFLDASTLIRRAAMDRPWSEALANLRRLPLSYPKATA